MFRVASTETANQPCQQDVIEGVNLDKENVITLHTDGDGCKPADKPDVSGKILPEK